MLFLGCLRNSQSEGGRFWYFSSEGVQYRNVFLSEDSAYTEVIMHLPIGLLALVKDS